MLPDERAPYAKAVFAASQPTRLPGLGDTRVLLPDALARLAKELPLSRRAIEALALDLRIVPNAYLKNLFQFGLEGQAKLLRSTVALIGDSPAISRAGELLALNGVGELRIMIPVLTVSMDGIVEAQAVALGRSASRRNASCEVAGYAVDLRAGRPVNSSSGVAAAAACLDDSAEEQLLQFACRLARVPLVLVGVQGTRAQATTVMPGDPGVALVYRASHPHLDPRRAGMPVEPQAELMAGAWISEQVTRLLLGEDKLLTGQLLYADMQTGEMDEYPLR